MSDLAVLKKAFNDKSVQHLFTRLMAHTDGLLQYLVFTRSLDFLERYKRVSLSIPDDASILEVGSGKIGLGCFLNSTHDIVGVDVQSAIIESSLTEKKVVSSAGDLPFIDNAFDVVVSVDCLEHLPPQVRAKFFVESKRVAKTYVILHVPIYELAYHADVQFAKIYERLFHSKNWEHAQHLDYGLPTLGSLKETYPDSCIMFDQNLTVNYILSILQKIPFAGWLTWVFYLPLLKNRHENPPYYSATIVWTKPMVR